MQDQREELIRLNVAIGNAESVPDPTFLARAIAPELAFRRADGTCLGREEFLKAVKASPERHTEIESINILGPNRAIVTCLVTMKTDAIPRRFHNARLFIRDKDEQWKLLGWANEPV